MEPSTITKEVTTYACPVCGTEHKLYQQAVSCAAFQEEIDKIKNVWNPNELQWFQLRSKNNKDFTQWILPYALRTTTYGNGPSGSCKSKEWQLYDLNWNSYSTSEYWSFIQTISMRDGWEQFGLYPRMNGIYSDRFSRFKNMNVNQKESIRIFWNEFLYKRVKDQIAKMTLGELYESTVYFSMQYLWNWIHYEDEKENAWLGRPEIADVVRNLVKDPYLIVAKEFEDVD